MHSENRSGQGGQDEFEAIQGDADMSSALAVVEQAADQNWILVQPGLFDYPLADGETPALHANSCRHCGAKYFPKRTICPHCVSRDLEDCFLSRRGIIYASTVVYIDSPVGIKAPYACGYVDLPEDKVRIFSLFSGADPVSFLPGNEVELVLGPVRKNDTGQDVIGYMFKQVL